jgi:hypothetical protein
METTLRSVKIFGAMLQKAGPYLLLEILLPGGTLFALLLFLYRRQRDGAELPRAIFVIVRVIDNVRRQIVWVGQFYGVASLWRGRARERDGLEALAMAPAF